MHLPHLVLAADVGVCGLLNPGLCSSENLPALCSDSDECGSGVPGIILNKGLWHKYRNQYWGTRAGYRPAVWATSGRPNPRGGARPLATRNPPTEEGRGPSAHRLVDPIELALGSTERGAHARLYETRLSSLSGSYSKRPNDPPVFGECPINLAIVPNTLYTKSKPTRV